MTYTGDVTRGGPADVRELAGLLISKVSVGPMDNNAYLLECRETGERALVDAADDAATLLGLLGDGRLEQVVTTHRHRDHWQALDEVVAATGARTAAGRDDAEAIPGTTDTELSRRRPGPGRPGRARGRDAGRPHPRLGRAALPGPGRRARTCSPATRCSPAVLGKTTNPETSPR